MMNLVNGDIKNPIIHNINHTSLINKKVMERKIDQFRENNRMPSA